MGSVPCRPCSVGAGRAMGRGSPRRTCSPPTAGSPGACGAIPPLPCTRFFPTVFTLAWPCPPVGAASAHVARVCGGRVPFPAPRVHSPSVSVLGKPFSSRVSFVTRGRLSGDTACVGQGEPCVCLLLLGGGSCCPASVCFQLVEPVPEQDSPGSSGSAGNVRLRGLPLGSGVRAVGAPPSPRGGQLYLRNDVPLGAGE